MFGFANVAHFFASVGKDVVKIAKAVGPAVNKIDAKVEANKPTIEALTSLVSPKAAAIEDAAFNLFGRAAHVISEGSDAANAGGVSLSLDSQFVADFKALLPEVEEYAKNRGIVKPTAPTV